MFYWPREAEKFRPDFSPKLCPQIRETVATWKGSFSPMALSLASPRFGTQKNSVSSVRPLPSPSFTAPPDFPSSLVQKHRGVVVKQAAPEKDQRDQDPFRPSGI